MPDANAQPEPPELGQEIHGPGKQFFENVVHDNLLESLLELTAAVWTCQDRILILENVLTDLLGEGQDLARLVESYEPTAEQEAARAAAREELIKSVFRSFSRRHVPGGPQSVTGAES